MTFALIIGTVKRGPAKSIRGIHFNFSIWADCVKGSYPQQAVVRPAYRSALLGHALYRARGGRVSNPLPPLKEHICEDSGAPIFKKV